MAALHICLLGRFFVHRQECAVHGLDARKVQELFFYLLLRRNHPHHRENLAGMLWGDTTTVQSRANLRRTLWQLQTALEPYQIPASPAFLQVESDWVSIHPQADLWLDVSILEHAFKAVADIPGEELASCHAQALADAVDLYQGDLLEGWYYDWCLYERERLQNIYLASLDKLMGYCETVGAYERGLAYGERSLAYDRAREQTHRRLMRLFFLQGNRTTALRQYQRCVAALREDLGVSPTQYTTDLYNQIKDNCLADAPPRPQGSPSAQYMSLSSHLDQLKQCFVLLAAAQEAVQISIRSIEQVLDRQI